MKLLLCHRFVIFYGSLVDFLKIPLEKILDQRDFSVIYSCIHAKVYNSLIMQQRKMIEAFNGSQ